MKKIFSAFALSIVFLICFGLSSAQVATSGQARSISSNDALRVVTDPRIDLKPVKVSAASARFIKQTLLPKLKELWSGDVCKEDFKVLAAANGSFTESGAVQTAYLYQYCDKDDVLINDGIAVFEKSSLAVNVIFSTPPKNEDENIAYDGGYAFDLASLQDINKNGVDELVVYCGDIEGGAFARSIDILELSDKKPKVIGSTYIWGMNNWEGEHGDRITVKPGRIPVFYSESFKHKGKTWVKTKSQKPTKMDEGANQYKLLF